MKDSIYFNPAAFKHGVTESDIRKAIETKIYEGSLEDFVDKYTIIGFNAAGNLLEIMYNIINSESINRVVRKLQFLNNFLIKTAFF